MQRISPGCRRGWPRILLVPLSAGVLAFTASDAAATLRIESHNDPAGDPTTMTYRLDSPAWTPGSAIDFMLREGTSQSFGPGPGTYTVQATPPSGWRVNDIRCVGPDPAQFVIDVPNGLVTMTHGEGAEQTCAFTNGKVGAAGPPSSGVSPSPPANELPKVVIPEEIALLRVRAGTGYVAVRFRLVRSSVIKLQLRRGDRVVAKRRTVRGGGIREEEIRLRPKLRQRLKDRGRKRVPVTLRAVVAEPGGTTKVFRYRVIVPL
jgi:ribosomal protein L31E